MNALLLILLSIFTVLFRLAPHPANFTPVAALALLSSAVMPRGSGLAFVAGTMLVSDALIGFYDWRIMLAVYASVLMVSLAGYFLRDNMSARRVIVISLLGAAFFFLLTNFAVWLFGTMYAHNWSGLAQSYAMALPFFRSSLLGDVFWSVVFFAAYERLRKRSMAPPEPAYALIHRS